MMSLPDLTSHCRQLLRESDALTAHDRFGEWVEEVAHWLDETYRDSGFSAKWSALPSSALVIGNQYYDEPEAWNHFARTVQTRLDWLGGLSGSLQRVTATQTRRDRGASVRKVFLSHSSEVGLGASSGPDIPESSLMDCFSMRARSLAVPGSSSISSHKIFMAPICCDTNCLWSGSPRRTSFPTLLPVPQLGTVVSPFLSSASPTYCLKMEPL